MKRHLFFATLLVAAHPLKTVSGAELPAAFSVETAGLTLQLDEQGRIAGSSKAELTGQTQLAGCSPVGAVTATKLEGGGYQFARKLTDEQKHNVTLTERFTPTKNSIRWEVAIVSDDAPWSTAIETRLQYPATETTRFWTAWSDPERKRGWHDPLVMKPFADTTWQYGALTPFSDDINNCAGKPLDPYFMAVPLVTIAEPKADAAVSLVFSPEDITLAKARLTTTRAGALDYSRVNHRIGGGKTIRFSTDILAHEADWRGGLRWMTNRYPKFFDAPNPDSARVAGCGAYSAGEQEIDVAKFKAMAFGFNWKLSDDFPYMGMYIPPVKSMDETWERSAFLKESAHTGPVTSCRKLNDYAKYMKRNGFAVLSYFNVTEFGKNMVKRKPVRKADDPELWKDPAGFLKYKLPNAALSPEVITWGGGLVTDIGDPDYMKFALEQADRNTRMLPDTDGLCIDRMDWLNEINPNADDGVTWFKDKPARSLCVSWMAFTEKLSAQMKAANKLFFANPHYPRFDLLRYADGIYVEHGGCNETFNASALIGIRKPVIAWTLEKSPADFDAFFHRHLFMGVFPTAPYPHNHHCMPPSPANDKAYMDYGPLMSAMRGRKWVLTPRCVESDAAKVNLFEVPGGYALPVTFAVTAKSVAVRVRNIPGLKNTKCEVIHPGVEKPVALAGTFKDDALELNVPIVRGCAMVRLLAASESKTMKN